MVSEYKFAGAGFVYSSIVPHIIRTGITYNNGNKTPYAGISVHECNLICSNDPECESFNVYVPSNMPTNDNLQRCSFWKHAPLNTLVTLAPAANHVKWDFWTVSPIDGPSVVTNTITVTI